MEALENKVSPYQWLFGGLDGFYISFVMRYVESLIGMATVIASFAVPHLILVTFFPFHKDSDVLVHPVVLLLLRTAATGILLADALKLVLLHPSISREARWLFVRLDLIGKAIYLFWVLDYSWYYSPPVPWLNIGLVSPQLVAVAICVANEYRNAARP